LDENEPDACLVPTSNSHESGDAFLATVQPSARVAAVCVVPSTSAPKFPSAVVGTRYCLVAIYPLKFIGTRWLICDLTRMARKFITATQVIRIFPVITCEFSVRKKTQQWASPGDFRLAHSALKRIAPTTLPTTTTFPRAEECSVWPVVEND